MKTILVVEDELSIRSFVCLNLKKKEYQEIRSLMKSGEPIIPAIQRWWM